MVTVKTFQNNIGTFHNDFVNRYYQGNPQGLQRTVTPQAFAAIGRTLANYAIELGFDPTDVTNAMDALQPELQRTDVFAGGMLRSSAECITILAEDVIRRDNLSGRLAEALRQSVQRGLTEQITPDAILDTVNRTVRIGQTSLANEQMVADTFVDVANASSQLWFNRTASQPRLNPNSQIVLADAVGSLIGLISGPVGSIIAGALWSIAVAEAHG